MTNFKTWLTLKALRTAGEITIYTKKELDVELGLKPAPGAIPEKHKVYINGRWREYCFYTPDQCVPIKRKPRIIEALPLTPDNLCKSLYVINKSAKISRDTKSSAYLQGEHGVVKRSKTREMTLYDLKNQTIEKMHKEGMLEIRGYHLQKQQVRDYATNKEIEQKAYLILYGYAHYTFHQFTKTEPKDMTYLGEIGIISSERKKIAIKFGEAVALLTEYLKKID